MAQGRRTSLNRETLLNRNRFERHGDASSPEFRAAGNSGAAHGTEGGATDCRRKLTLPPRFS